MEYNKKNSDQKQQEFLDLYESSRESLVRFAKSMTKNIDDAKDLVHFSVNTLIGFGGVMYGNMMDSIYHTNNDFNFNNRNSNPSVALFVIEPTASVEFNITKHFRIGLDVSYRYMTSIRENTNYTNSTSLKDVKLNGLSGGLTFQFGCF